MTLLGIAAAIAVAAVVIALVVGGGDDNGDETTTQTTAAQTETGTGDTTPTETEQNQTTTEVEPPEPEPVRIRVKGGEPVGGAEEIEVDKGDRLMIDVTADAPDHAHLHGYDIEKDVGPGQTAKFRVKANLEGIYELELHDSGAQLAKVRVNP
jgi:FtsP/CotA-like multicopper oxidase with cupredoxin domain